MNHFVILTTLAVLQHKTSKQFVRVLLWIQEHQFGTVMVKIWTFRKALCRIFSREIWSFILIQGSIDSRTDTYWPWPRTAKRLFWMNYGTQINGCWFCEKIIFSDQAIFNLKASLTVKITTIGVQKIREYLIVEKPMQPQRVTFWYKFWTGGIIRNSYLLWHDNPVFEPKF